MKTIVKADASTYKIELHDLSVLFLYSSKHPLILPIFLYMLAMTDKARRGQLARVLGGHPMNSEVIAQLFGVGQSTVRTAIKVMIECDLVRFNEITLPAKKDGPPIKRRTYTVMIHKLTKRAVDLSKDIARSNKGAVKARRMGLDPEALLRLIGDTFQWVPQVGQHPANDAAASGAVSDNDDSACVRTLTQANQHRLRPYTDAIYTSSSQVLKSKEKLVHSVYSGVTPKNIEVSGVTPTPEILAGNLEPRHIDVTNAPADGLSAEIPGGDKNRVTPSETAVNAEHSEYSPKSAISDPQKAQNSPVIALTHPAIAKLANHASNDPIDANLGHVSEAPATADKPNRPGARLIEAHRQNGRVDPLEFAFEASAAANDSELGEATLTLRNWGMPEIWERLLIEFCRITKVYPSRSNKGKASRSAWTAAMERMTQDKQTDSFVEACQIAVEKARRGTWTITGPFSIKVDAADIKSRKSRGEWPGIEEFIRKHYRGGELDRLDRSEESATQEEVVTQTTDVVWTITKAQQEQLMKARIVKDRAVLWKKFIPDAVIVIRGDQNSPVNEYNFVGPETGTVKVIP